MIPASMHLISAALSFGGLTAFYELWISSNNTHFCFLLHDEEN